MNTFDILVSDLQIKSADADSFTAVFTPEKDFPPFAGHFPDFPIMPGVAQISVVTAAVRKVYGSGSVLQEVQRVKFTNPSLPGVELEIAAKVVASEESCKAFQIQITGGGKRISTLKLLYAVQE